LIQIAYKIYLQVGTHIWWKKNAPLEQKIGHFREDFKNHYGKHRDGSTGSLATQTANFFHKSIRTS
jgi:hypothetical protein